MARRDADEPPAPTPLTARRGSTVGAAADRVGWRFVAAALGLSLAGVSAPIAVTAMAATSGPPGPPLVASALVALLVLAPTGVGLATVLSGLRRVAAALSARSDSEAEQAVLRVLVDALIFGYSLGLAAVTPNAGLAAPYLAVAAFGLVAAWALLLHVVLWPAAPLVRRFGAMALDIVLFSAFLHYGGDAVAFWYPLYLLAIVYAGFRFGLGALLGTAIGSILGFAAVVLSTDFWRQQPGLATGLILALAVLPGFIAGAIRAAASARDEAARAEADRRRVLRLIADNLRAPPVAARSIGTVASAIHDVLDFAALEAGTFAPSVEAFDLRALVKHSLAPLQATAAEAGVLLRWRIDPHLPGRLRGRAQALARILVSLAGHAVGAREAGTVRIALDVAACDARRLRLRLIVENAGGDREPDLAPGFTPGEGPLALLLARRLVALMGGGFAIERTPGQRTRLAVTLTLAIEAGAAEPILDLANRPVLIASEDAAFAGEITEPLAAWRGDVRWLGDADGALAGLSGRDTTEPSLMSPILIIDGRRKWLSALSLAHRAARLGGAAPFVLLVAEAEQIESLGEVDDGELDGFIPLPLSEQLLANALHALPLGPLRPVAPDRPAPPLVADPPGSVAEPRAASADAREPHSERITPIAAHPKFVPETAGALDMRAIEGLRALGGGSGFLGEVIETFQADAQQIMERLDQAVAAADVAGFAQGLVALRRAASPLGGTQLCQLLTSLQGLTASQLRQLGAIHIQQLDTEIDRLAVALTEFLPASEASRQ